MESNHSSNAEITLASSIVSLVGLIAHAFTKDNITWAIGIVAACVTIAAGVATIREKHLAIRERRLSIKKLEKETE